MARHLFYYDESEHSRVINRKTIVDTGFYDGFVVAVVGWEEDYDPVLEERYLDFEKKFLSPNSKELKSTAISPKQLQHGFASLNKANLALIEKLLGILDERTLLYYSYASKIELLVRQLFGSPRNFQHLNPDSMVYSITKALVTYRPVEVLESLNESPEKILEAIRSFLIERIRIDRGNEELKFSEIERFSVILNTLNAIDPPQNINWDYSLPLEGFSAYLSERNIDDYILTIDREATTTDTARALGLRPIREGDSKLCFGVRIADMVAGLIAKLMKAVHNDLKYPDEESTLEKNLLDERWFEIDDRRLALYKSLRRALKENDQSWFKACTGAYSDDLVVLLSLVDYFDGYESSEELAERKGTHRELFNALACQELSGYFDNMGWPQIPFPPQENGNGAVTPGNPPRDGKPSPLPVGTRPKTYSVLSTAIDPLLGIPLAVIEEGSQAVTYRLPVELTGWAWGLMASVSEIGLLPSLVRFQMVDGVCRADIL